MCANEGCENQAQRGGLCCTHGVLHECIREGCTNTNQARGWLCKKHRADAESRNDSRPAKRKRVVEGNHGQVGGRVGRKRHGAETKRRVYICKEEGCDKQVQMGGLCKNHGMKRGFSYKKYTCKQMDARLFRKKTGCAPSTERRGKYTFARKRDATTRSKREVYAEHTG